jgi:hypothetical protein
MALKYCRVRTSTTTTITTMATTITMVTTTRHTTTTMITTIKTTTDTSTRRAIPTRGFLPLNVMIWVENIEDALSTADPGRAEQFASNAAEYVSALEALDEEMRGLFASIPEDERKLVIDHAALGYFARDYGFHILGTVIPSTTDQAEPSAQAMAELIRTIESESIQGDLRWWDRVAGFAESRSYGSTGGGPGDIGAHVAYRVPHADRYTWRYVSWFHPLQRGADRTGAYGIVAFLE